MSLLARTSLAQPLAVCRQRQRVCSRAICKAWPDLAPAAADSDVGPSTSWSDRLPLAASVASAALLSACAASAADLQPLYQLSELDAATAHNLESILRPLFTIFSVLYIIRIPMTWYPSIDGKQLPWLIAYAPTEPFLMGARKIIPLVGGVDITPIVMVALISFFNEILLGPQGILLLIQRQAASGF